MLRCGGDVPALLVRTFLAMHPPVEATLALSPLSAHYTSRKFNLI